MLGGRAWRDAILAQAPLEPKMAEFVWKAPRQNVPRSLTDPSLIYAQLAGIASCAPPAKVGRSPPSLNERSEAPRIPRALLISPLQMLVWAFGERFGISSQFWLAPNAVDGIDLRLWLSPGDLLGILSRFWLAWGPLWVISYDSGSLGDFLGEGIPR